MRMSKAFGERDVDAFLETVDPDDFEEWSAFFALEPDGWAAISMAVQRISYMIALTNSSKKIREETYRFRTGAWSIGVSPEVEKSRWQAQSIRSEVAEKLKWKREQKRKPLVIDTNGQLTRQSE